MLPAFSTIIVTPLLNWRIVLDWRIAASRQPPAFDAGVIVSKGGAIGKQGGVCGLGRSLRRKAGRPSTVFP